LRAAPRGNLYAALVRCVVARPCLVQYKDSMITKNATDDYADDHSYDSLRLMADYMQMWRQYIDVPHVQIKRRSPA